jgi:hypothetical protein
MTATLKKSWNGRRVEMLVLNDATDIDYITKLGKLTVNIQYNYTQKSAVLIFVGDLPSLAVEPATSSSFNRMLHLLATVIFVSTQKRMEKRVETIGYNLTNTKFKRESLHLVQTLEEAKNLVAQLATV